MCTSWRSKLLVWIPVPFALSLSSEIICQYREHGNGNWIPYLTKTESTPLEEGRGRRNKGCASFCQVHLLNNADTLNNTNCVLCLASDELNSEVMFQTSKPAKLKPELSEVSWLLEMLDLRLSILNASTFREELLASPERDLRLGVLKVNQTAPLVPLRCPWDGLSILWAETGVVNQRVDKVEVMTLIKIKSSYAHTEWNQIISPCIPFMLGGYTEVDLLAYCFHFVCTRTS